MVQQTLAEGIAGIRGEFIGKFGDGLSLDVVRKYTIGLESFIREKIGNYRPFLIVGCDPRPSSKEIYSSILDYLCCRFESIGISTTPIIQNTVRMRNADGGVIVSGSHNPMNQNGLKFLREDGALLNPRDIEELIQRVHSQKDYDYFLNNPPIDKRKDGWLSNADSVDGYVNFVFNLLGDDAKKIKDFVEKEKLKVVLDPNGGSACVVIEQIMEKLGIKCEITNNQLGHPRRGIEPKKETLTGLVKLIGENGIGVGFDFDADRAEIVIPFYDNSWYLKEHGNVIDGQYCLGVISQYVLEKMKENKEETNGRYIITTVATSSLIGEIAKPYGVNVEEVGVGEINVVNKMLELEAIVGGEGSASGFIHPKTRCRDGVLLFLYMLGAMAEKEMPLGQILDNLPKYYTLRDDNQKCSPEQVEKIYSFLEDYYEKQSFTIKKPDEYSGVKAVAPNGDWVMVRVSLTEPGEEKKVRIFSDSNNKNRAEKLLGDGIIALEKAKK